MEQKQLIVKLLSAGLFPIPVEGSTQRENGKGLVFHGDLDAFIASAKALKTETVFVASQVFSEADFVYAPMDEMEPFGVSAHPAVELDSVVPALRRFREYIGKETSFKLSVSLQVSSLNLYLEEPWWKEFLALWMEAVDQVEEQRLSDRMRTIAEREEAERGLLDRLHNLLDDARFTSLPTQRAMRAYALEMIPDLEQISEPALRNEIQEMDARIKARGLNKRRAW